jgi:DNA-binding PadR family transcriptional regulator
MMNEESNSNNDDIPENEEIAKGYGRGFGNGHGRGRGGHSGRRGRGRGRRWMGGHSLMDVRLVEPALLAFLQKKPSHGYGLLEELDKISLGSIQPSVIYRILRDYEEIGLVESGWDKDETQGPPRRVYGITEAGIATLGRARTSLEETVERIEALLKIIDQEE